MEEGSVQGLAFGRHERTSDTFVLAANDWKKYHLRPFTEPARVMSKNKKRPSTTVDETRGTDVGRPPNTQTEKKADLGFFTAIHAKSLAPYKTVTAITPGLSILIYNFEQLFSIRFTDDS